MKKKLLVLTMGIGLVAGIKAQTLYVPNGTNGIGTSTNGNVGIGILNPSFNLDVNGTGHINGHVSIGHTYNGQSLNVGGNLYVIAGNTWVNDGYGFISATYPAVGMFPNSTTGIGFNTNGTEKMRIDNNGNVGIGTTSPSSMLTVTGNIQAGINPNGNAILSPGNASNAGYFQIILPSGTRLGYIGFNPTDIQYTAESTNSGHLFYTSSLPRMYINSIGNVLIGKTSQNNTAYKLDVSGKVRADEITVNTTGADFVFEPKYKLLTLAEVEAFIKANKHLPDIAPAADMQTNGVSMGEMQAKLLQKVEELTLYVIELKKENEEMQKKYALLEQKYLEQEKNQIVISTSK